MLDTLANMITSKDMKARQAPLRKTYEELPTSAQIIDHATTRSDRVEPNQPLYGEVEFGDPNRTRLQISLHDGVGGNSDLPVPGELFCAAIASCLDSTVRVVCNRLNIELKTLEIHVEGRADLRGALRMDPAVPVAFQSLAIIANIIPKEDVPTAHIDAILAAAEQSCVIIQTLRSAPQISMTRA